MLNRNFANIMLGMLSINSTGYGDNSIPLVNKNGQNVTTASSAYAGKILNHIANSTAVKVGSVTNSGFAIGSGTTAETFDDYALANPIDDTNFSVVAASRGKNSSDQSVILQQIWQYNGTSEIQINEIGLFADCFGGIVAMFDRTVLDSPITVNNGDTFTIALTIGGKATVTVN